MSQDTDELLRIPGAMYLCAWCDAPIDLPPGRLAGRPAVKHGMCERCVHLKLGRPVPVRSRRRSRSARSA